VGAVKRCLVQALAVLLFALGAWQVGEGAWIHAKAALAQALIKRAWAGAQAGGEAIRPWPWADTTPVARLSVPELGIDQIVLAGVSGRTLAFGPGHVDGTAAPGAPGLAVISAHRDTHFAFLRDIKTGQTVALTDRSGKRHLYRVTDTRVVDSDRMALDATGDTPRLALTTCYPFDATTPGGPMRYVVFAEAAPDASGPRIAASLGTDPPR
jgi:sortase A